jgi:hypothetical protein
MAMILAMPEADLKVGRYGANVEADVQVRLPGIGN